MSRRRLILSLATTVVALFALAATARAEHGSPPSYLDAGPLTLTVSIESRAGQVYHDRNDPGRAGTTCTAAANDDGTTDDTGECYNDRSQLKSKDVTTAEGTAAGCQRIPGATVPGVATWDGAWFNRTPGGTIPDACGDPTTGGAKGRVYTGAAITGVGSIGAAGGGDLANGGCVQAFAEDDTAGNVASGAVKAVQAATGSPHVNTDDDTDTGICFDYL